MSEPRNAEPANKATRLEKLRKGLGLSLYEVADLIKKSHSTVARYESDPKAGIKPEVMRALARALKTSVEYIETGRHPESNAAVLPEAEYIEVPFFSQTAYGTFAANCLDSLPEEHDTMWVLKRAGRDYRGARSLEIRGNSMAPKFPHGCCVLVRPVQDGDWQYATGVHAISLRNEMFIIKRITSNENGQLVLTSDSNGETMRIELGDILCMWKVGEKVYEPAED